jgi:SAM-dependent methyltransferase
MVLRCPRCGNEQLTVFLSEEAVRLETLMRAQFVFDRVEKTPRPEERKDLTSFAHGAMATLLECPQCCVLVRREEHAEPVRTYEEDEYDSTVMSALLPRYTEAFRAKEQPYRALLGLGARVIEVGPHFGAFMEVAREWGWQSAGVDIGKDTTRFIRSRGFEIHQCRLEQCGFEEGSYDGIFIWNCFEQIPEPGSLLGEAQKVLKNDGVLVLRTPNALFYRICQHRLRATPDGDLSLWIVRALGYNNLLAFPYLYGYDSASLKAVAEASGFQTEAELNSELITLPFPELAPWIVEENRAAYAMIRTWSELEDREREGLLTAPWIELIFRKAQ